MSPGRSRKELARVTKRKAVALIAVLLLMAGSREAVAGTTGKVAGTVLDALGYPLPGATVHVDGTGFAVETDDEGQFVLLNIPPGTYSASITHLDFATVLVREIVVSADNTTRITVPMAEASREVEVVEVTASRRALEMSLTSSIASLQSEEIEKLPVQELQDVVNLQAGVVDGHFRGGRLGEVQFQLDGVSMNNAFDNKSSLTVDRSLLQEVQVISGTFDAEYGQAMSGVVNAVLKEGGQELEWNTEAYTGGFVFPGRDDRLVDDEVRPADIQNYQLGANGPTPLPLTTFLVSARRFTQDAYITASRRFTPTDSSDFQNKIFLPTGDGGQEALGYFREWSGALKLTNRSVPGAKVSYQALLNDVEARDTNWAFRFNPDGLPIQRRFSIAHGFDWSHTITAKTFLDLSARQNYLDYTSWVYEDVFDPRYDAAGPPRGDIEYEDGAVVQGVDFGRYRVETNELVLKGTFVSQAHADHLIKVGGELHVPVVRFGTPGYLQYTTVDGVETLVRHVDEPPDFPGVQEYHPWIGAAFAQEQLEWPDLTLRAGMRLDYFDARSYVPGDPANPANSIQGAPESTPVPTDRKVSLSPRLGLAYPIGGSSALHFAYGHFRQYPPIGEMFSNANYSVLRNLQAGGISFGVLGNPDVGPETTVQYEMGYRHAFSQAFDVDATVFFKDVRDLLGVEFISTYNGAEYARLTNVDFGNVLGFTIALDHQELGPASVSLDYTWQRVQGNASDPRETATRASAGEDPRPRLIPLSWDQRHTLNVTVALDRPGVYSSSAILRVVSGQPYTPVLEAGFGEDLGTNSGRRPSAFLLDLRAERSLGTALGTNAAMFLRAFNVFDTRYFNGFVFESTGSPYYSRFPEADRVALGNPTRFHQPRRIEIGVRLGSGGS
jgi:hypothetical protein